MTVPAWCMPESGLIPGTAWSPDFLSTPEGPVKDGDGHTGRPKPRPCEQASRWRGLHVGTGGGRSHGFGQEGLALPPLPGEARSRDGPC